MTMRITLTMNTGPRLSVDPASIAVIEETDDGSLIHIAGSRIAVTETREEILALERAVEIKRHALALHATTEMVTRTAISSAKKMIRALERSEAEDAC